MYFKMDGGDSTHDPHATSGPSPSSLIVAVVLGNRSMISAIRRPSTFEIETTGTVIYLEETQHLYVPQIPLVIVQRVNRVVRIRILMVGHHNHSRCSQLIHLARKRHLFPYIVHLLRDRTRRVRSDTNDESNTVGKVQSAHSTPI